MRRWCVAGALRHYQPLVQTKGGSYRRVRDILGVYACLEEAVSHIKLSKYLAFAAVSKNFVDAS